MPFAWCGPDGLVASATGVVASAVGAAAATVVPEVSAALALVPKAMRPAAPPATTTAAKQGRYG